MELQHPSAPVADRVGWRLSRLVAATGIFIALFVGAGLKPAAADYWTGACTWRSDACVSATVGGKNTSNKTQWVGWVQGKTYAYGEVSKIEVWGDGFYYSANTSAKSLTWSVQRWVRSGTNVCSRITYKVGTSSVACFGIRV